MKIFSSLKDSALKTLENKWGQFVAITLVAYVIGSGVGFVPYVGTLLTLAVIPLGYGYSIAILKNYRGGEIQLVDIFDAYKNTEVLGRVLLTLLLRGVYIFLWLLLLIVPGFIKSISYTMTEFVLNDNPEVRRRHNPQQRIDERTQMGIFPVFVVFHRLVFAQYPHFRNRIPVVHAILYVGEISILPWFARR